MSQSDSTNQRTSLLGQEAYRNPRHAEEAAALEAHDKAIAEGAATPGDDAQSQQPVHNWEKRYKDLQSYNSRKINELQDQIKNLEVQSAPKLTLPKTEDEINVFKQANPETFAIIETMAANIAQSQMANYDAKLAAVSGDLMETKIERAVLAIKQAHPDFEAVVNSEAFAMWAQSQTKEVQDWVFNNPDDPQKAIRALSLYKYESGQGTQTNTQSDPMQGADMDVNARNRVSTPESTDRNHPAYIWKESEIAKMPRDEFSKWQDVILLAQREGRIALGQ